MLSDKGIKVQNGALYSPESIEKTERLDRTLNDMDRTMAMKIDHVRDGTELWAEAVNTAAYSRNRIYTKASNEVGKTSYEVIMRKTPNFGLLRCFGTKRFCTHTKFEENIPKYQARAKIGILVGFVSANS